MQPKLLRVPSLFSAIAVGILVATGSVVRAQDQWKERIQSKVVELARAIEEHVEARRAAEKMETTLALLEGVSEDPKDSNRLKMLERFSPGLGRADQEVHYLELEADLSRETLGSENPRFKRLAEELQKRQAALKRRTADAVTKAQAELKDARAESERARQKRDEAGQRVETLKAELVTLAERR